MKTTILIIEDNIHHLSRIILALKSAHERYHLLTTKDGEEAVDIATEFNPDLIIADWELKGSNLNGLQVVTQLKKQKTTSGIPIIMATQFTSSEMLDKALNAGAIDYLRKPIDKTELLARVRSALILKSMQRTEIIKENNVKIKILFLAANPMDQARLNLGKEYQAISKSLIKIAKLRDSFALAQEFAVNNDTLLQALLDEKPNIVHFSGHGENEGIILEDHNSSSYLVPSEAIQELFSIFSETIECVILNSCFSLEQAKAISKHIPYTIGIKNTISDGESIAFTLGFYKALGSGEPIPSAYKVGIINIKLLGVSGENLPELITSDL